MAVDMFDYSRSIITEDDVRDVARDFCLTFELLRDLMTIQAQKERLKIEKEQQKAKKGSELVTQLATQSSRSKSRKKRSALIPLGLSTWKKTKYENEPLSLPQGPTTPENTYINTVNPNFSGESKTSQDETSTRFLLNLFLREIVGIMREGLRLIPWSESQYPVHLGLS
jgi:hypothetical protein